jgi:hypothetical protein
MRIPLTEDVLNLLPFNQNIILKVKVIASVLIKEQSTEKPQAKIIELSDELVFKLTEAPIIIDLNGINTEYGKDDFIRIDASSTYDPDITGMHYYLPFKFKWECPNNLTKCKNQAESSSKPYGLSLHASNMVSSNLKLNEWHKFNAIAERQNKIQAQEFSIKIIDHQHIPQIGTLITLCFVKY